MVEQRWVILGVLFLARTSMGFQFQSIASASPFMVAEIGLTYAQIGTLIGLFMLPGVVVALPGGLLSRYFADKRVCASGLALMVLGGVIAGVSSSYSVVFAGRLISGIGTVLFNVVIIKMVTDWFADKEIITSMGVILASWPFGIALALVSQSTIAEAYSWQAIMYVTAFACGIALSIVVLLYRNPPAAAEDLTAIPFSFRVPMREFLSVSVAGIAWGVFNAGFVIFFAFSPALLQDRGMTSVDSAALASIGLWVSLISVPIGGYLTERIGWPVLIIVTFSLLGGLALLLFPYLPVPILLSILVGIGIGPAGAIVALPSKALSPENRGPGIGVFFTWYYGVMTIGPAVAGFGRDLTGSPAPALLFGGLIFASTAFFVLMFRLLTVNKVIREVAT